MELTEQAIMQKFHETKPNGMIDNARAGEVMGIILELFKGQKGVDVGGGPCPMSGVKVVEDNAEINAFNLDEKPESLDFIFSSHCIEHLQKDEWKKALKHWWECLKINGVLFLYLPHEKSGWNPETNEVAAKYHFWQPTNERLINALNEFGKYESIITNQDVNEFNSFMFIVRKLS